MMNSAILKIISTVLVTNLVVGCASLEFHPDVPGQAYVATGAEAIARQMPVVVSEYPDKSFNRIGEPDAFEENGKIRIRIDSRTAVVYYEQRLFETARGHYTNLIYRIHFEEVPVSLLPFNLTAGQNVGLIIIITLNDRQQPILVTTVHTCGCYLAMVPTNYLQADALPKGWDTESQRVYGATLPGLLRFENVPGEERIVVILKNAIHRVIHIDVAPVDALIEQYGSRSMVMKPVSELDALMLDNGKRFVSMFEADGGRSGYVRDSRKPFEFLFMSWWAMDRHVGEDKRYGKPGQGSPPFNTSLKPWARSESDMRDFPRFLQYWGWRL